MKKSIITTAIAVGWMVASTTASAITVTHNFTVTWTLTAPTCEVTTGKETVNVPMGQVDTSSFSDAGSLSPPVPFAIDITCAQAVSNGVTVTYSGTGATGDPGSLALTGEGSQGTASGIGIALFDRDGKSLPLNTASAVYPANQGDNPLSFTARYKAVSWPVGAGLANGTATFTLNYP